MASRTEDLPWPTAPPPRLPSMDEMDYVMHPSMPEPSAPPRLQHPSHPPITGSGSCPYSAAHRLDYHGSPLPSPNYNSVASLLSPVRNPAHSPQSHSQQPHLLSHHHQQQQQQHNHHNNHNNHHHHQNAGSQPHSHSHSHSQSHPHHPYDPVHPPPSGNHWFSHHPPPAPQPPHWGHPFGGHDTRSPSSGLFAPQQLPSLFPIDHHHQYLGGAGGNHHNSGGSTTGNGSGSSSNNNGSSNSNSSTGSSSSNGSTGGSGLGAGSGINPLFVPHHSVGQPSMDPFASSSWSLYRQHHRMPESAQRFNPGPHVHHGNPQPPSTTSAPAISPRSLPNPTMPDRHSQPQIQNSQQPDFVSFNHSASTSPASSARASPNPADGGSATHTPLGISSRSLNGQNGRQTPTRSEVSQAGQTRPNENPQGPAIVSSPTVSPPAHTPVAGRGSDESASHSGSGMSTSDSERRRATPSHRRAPAVEMQMSDDESDSSEEHMEEMFIQQLGVAGPPFALRVSEMAEERIRRQQLLRGAMTNKRIASKGALASLVSVEIDSLPESERTCVICYNEFGVPNPEGINEAPLRLPKCKHVFGDHCIKKWFEESDSCPYCRDKVPSEPLMRLTARSVNTIFAALPDGRTLSSAGSAGASAMTPDVGFLYRQAHGNPYVAAVGNSRATWQSARRSPPEDIDVRSRRTRPRHGSLRGATSTGSSNVGNARPNSFAGSSSSTPSSQQGSPGRDRYYNGPNINSPVHWQLHAQMEGRRMQGQPLRQQPMPTPHMQRGIMPLHMQHRPGQSSGPAGYSALSLTPDPFSGMLNMGPGHMSQGGQDSGFMNPLSSSGPTETTHSMGPVPPVEAGAPFPGPGSATPLFSQQLPPVGGLDDNAFDRSGPAVATPVNWSQH